MLVKGSLIVKEAEMIKILSECYTENYTKLYAFYSSSVAEYLAPPAIVHFIRTENKDKSWVLDGYVLIGYTLQWQNIMVTQYKTDSVVQ